MSILKYFVKLWNTLPVQLSNVEPLLKCVNILKTTQYIEKQSSCMNVYCHTKTVALLNSDKSLNTSSILSSNSRPAVDME